MLEKSPATLLYLFASMCRYESPIDVYKGQCHQMEWLPWLLDDTSLCIGNCTEGHNTLVINKVITNHFNKWIEKKSPNEKNA